MCYENHIQFRAIVTSLIDSYYLHLPMMKKQSKLINNKKKRASMLLIINRYSGIESKEIRFRNEL